MTDYYEIVRGEYDELSHRGFEWVKRTVEGEKIANTVFAIREEEQGWRITHLPTGFVLVSVYFETRDGAEQFARMVTNIYGDILDTDSITVFKDTRTDREEFAQFVILKDKINNFEGTFSINDLMKMGGE